MIKDLYKLLNKNFKNQEINSDIQLLAIGKMLSNQQLYIDRKNINDYEFKIFSQFGDDGIIQYLIKNINIKNETFIEFGVSNYLESNTRFLLMNNNWSGFIIDGSKNEIDYLKKQNWFWKYDLNAITEYITVDNINNILKKSKFNNVGILSIDLDGNDYYVLNAIDFEFFNPSIVIVEYNALFGMEKSISVIYDEFFNRVNAHYSNLYWGASIKAFNYLLSKLGYSLVCCNSNGVNAYFVKNSLLNDNVCKVDVYQSFKNSKFRDSKNINGDLTYITGNNRMNLLKGMKVLNVESNEVEDL